MKPQKIAIVIGHVAKKDEGADSPYLCKQEYSYNLDIAKRLKDIDADLYDVYTHSIIEYYERQKELAGQLNKLNYDLVLELHFNSAASSLANGTTCLYWFGSKKGKSVAQVISKGIADTFHTKIRDDNGCKALFDKRDRGYWFTFLPKATAVIIEPFFGSNIEALNFKDADKYAHTLYEILKNIDL